MFNVPNKFRVRTGPVASTDDIGNNGMFLVKLPRNQILKVVASDKMGWEHVSVSRDDRCPTWEEMQLVKDMFWGEDDTVVQYHVPTEDHVNLHSKCLHLWRPVGVDIPRPPSIMVGFKVDRPLR